MKARHLCIALFTLVLNAGAADSISERLQRGLFEEEANHNLNAAIKEYQSVVAQTDEQRRVTATAIFRLGECYRKLGKTNEASAYYERIVRDFSEQEQLVKSAREFLPRPRTGATPSTIPSDPVAVNLLREEVRVAEQVVQTTEKKMAAGKTTLSEVLDAKKEVLRLKRQLPENISPAQQRTLLEEQITIVKQLLFEFENRIALGILAPGEQLPIKRELLSLQRELASVGDVTPAASGETTGTAALTQAETEELAQVKSLAKNSPDLLNAPYRPGSILTPLQFAAQEGFVSVIEFLLAQGVPVDGPSRGSPPLVMAAERGHLRIVELLLDRKANVNAAATSDGRTALMAACDKGFKAVADLLIRRGADVNLANSRKATALHFAAVQGQDQIVEMLIEHKANPNVIGYGPANNSPPWPQFGGAYQNAAPLHLAAKAGFSEIVERLLKAGAAIDITNSVGTTPLHLALGEGKTSTARLLLERGANPGIPQSDGKTAFAFAIQSRDTELVRQMIRAGADVNRPAIESPREVQYPLHIAVRYAGMDVLALLLAAKPQLEVTNKPEVDTPLWTALKHRQPRALEMLIKAGADFNRLYARRSPLQFAVKYGDEPGVPILLEAGANPNQVDENGNSLLHHAVFSPPVIVAALLKHGANPNVLNFVSETPLSQTESGRREPFGESGPTRNLSGEARRAEFRESASLLRSSGADEFLRRRFEITVSRAAVAQYGAQGLQVFTRGTNVLNNYSLFELLASVYLDGGEKFRFPDFSNIRIRRLEGQKEVLVNVDAEEWLNSTNCAKDIPLQWGDDVEIPMKAHLLGEAWNALPSQQAGALNRCMQRTVRVSVAGTNFTVRLAPWVRDQRVRFSTPPTFSFASLAVAIQRQPEIKNLLRTTTDLTRVTVTRTEENGRPGRMRFDITTVALPDVAAVNTTLTPWRHDLWLREGDVIEIAEKQ